MRQDIGLGPTDRGPLWTNRTDRLMCLLVLGLTAGITLSVFNKIYEAQPTPFMDEVFHIPQGIQYCKGNFTYWDPKITTLPGLYILSIGGLIPLCKIWGLEVPCTVSSLRITNLVASFLNFCIIYDLQRRIHGVSMVLDVTILFNSLTLWLFPILYFFTFFYYTDPMSTLLILLMYDLHLVKDTKSAAFIGFIGCLVRQTNIVWVGFLLLETYPEVINQLLDLRYPVWKRHLTRFETCVDYFKILKRYMIMMFQQDGLPNILSLSIQIVKAIQGYLLVCGLFVLFVIINGGIVVGDRTAHQPAFHLLQLCYFALFSVVMGVPYFVCEIVPFLKAVFKNKKLSFHILFGLAALVMVSTIEHPYLLADNRHYVFYIWQRVYRKHFMFRYMLIPVYMFGAYGIIQQLKHTKITFRLHYCFCLFLCLVPQKLLEYRYFIIPYLLFRLNVKGSKWQVIGECCLYVIINIVTVYLFLTKTFYWLDSEEKQRIIW